MNNNERPRKKVDVWICEDTLDALPILGSAYGVRGNYILNQALDVWVWLARNGLLGREVIITCEGKSARMNLSVPQQPEQAIEKALGDFFN